MAEPLPGDGRVLASAEPPSPQPATTAPGTAPAAVAPPAPSATAAAVTPAAASEPVQPAPQVAAVSVIVHVATTAGVPVIEQAELQRWFAQADQLFMAAGIVFAPELQPLPEGFAELERIRDRHALKRFLVPHRINVFVVGRMHDPVVSETTKRAAAWQGFVPTSGMLAGAHIEADGKQPRTYLIVSATHGSGLTLSHELGHFFGVAHHRDPENIMSYGAQRSRFEEPQLKTFRHTLRALLRKRVLR